MFSSIHDNVYLDTDDYQLCVHSCILVDLVHFDVACVVFLTGWNSATLGGQSGQLTSDFQKIDPYQYHTNVCFYRTMLAYIYPLYAGYFYQIHQNI